MVLQTSSIILDLQATQPCCLHFNNLPTAINVTGVFRDNVSDLYVLLAYGPLKLDNHYTVVLKQKTVMDSRLLGRSINVRKLSGVVRFKRFRRFGKSAK